MLEYIFENRKYDNALRDVKSILFDVVSAEESKISSLMTKIYESTDEDYQAKLVDICNAQDECLKRVLKIFSELEKTLKKLDSYSRELKNLEKDNMAELIETYKGIVSEQAQTIKQQNQVVAAYSGGGIEEPQMVEEEVPQMIEENPQMEDVPQMIEEVPQMAEEVPQMVEETPQMEDVPQVENGDTNVESESINIMPYNDDISTIVETPVQEGVSVENANTQDVVDENSQAPLAEGEVPVETTTEQNEGSADEKPINIMPYNDDISTIVETPVQEGVSADNANTEESVDDNSQAPLIDVEAPVETTTEQNEGSDSEEKPRNIMPYNDDISTIEEVQGQEVSVDNANTEENAGDNPEAPLIDVEVPAQEGSQEVLSVPTVVEASTEENSDSSAVLIPAIGDSSSDEAPAEATEDSSSTPLIIPQVNADAPVAESSAESAVTIPVVEEAIPQTDDAANTNMVLKKSTADAPKVIITSASQTDKLRKSLQSQEEILKSSGFIGDNSQSVSDDGIASKQNQLENMMQQANELYTEGKVDEAQNMYNQISELNKSIQSESSPVI